MPTNPRTLMELLTNHTDALITALASLAATLALKPLNRRIVALTSEASYRSVMELMQLIEDGVQVEDIAAGIQLQRVIVAGRELKTAIDEENRIREELNRAMDREWVEDEGQ